MVIKNVDSHEKNSFKKQTPWIDSRCYKVESSISLKVNQVLLMASNNLSESFFTSNK